jgi:dynein light intermediate chain 1
MGQASGEAQHEAEDVMMAWKERGRGGGSVNLDGTPVATGAGTDGEGSLPPGLGEWTEPLGLPLCVVCQNVMLVLAPPDCSRVTC